MTPEQHFTQPPPRYTEATLVKRMEEVGDRAAIDLCSILTTIVDREYVRKDKNRLFPETRAAGDGVPGELLQAVRGV